MRIHFIKFHFHFHSITEGGPSAGADLQGGPPPKKALTSQEFNIKVENINLKTLYKSIELQKAINISRNKLNIFKYFFQPLNGARTRKLSI